MERRGLGKCPHVRAGALWVLFVRDTSPWSRGALDAQMLGGAAWRPRGPPTPNRQGGGEKGLASPGSAEGHGARRAGHGPTPPVVLRAPGFSSLAVRWRPHAIVVHWWPCGLEWPRAVVHHMGQRVLRVLVAALCLMNFLRAWGTETAAGLCCEIILGSRPVTSARVPRCARPSPLRAPDGPVWASAKSGAGRPTSEACVLNGVARQTTPPGESGQGADP